MKKRGISICLLIIISLSFISAGFFSEFLDKITGKGITGHAIVDDCSDVVALYHFDGNANDSSGNGNDGVVFGATSTTGKVGGAYDFDGDGDYVQIQNDVNTYLDFSQGSISLWYKPNGLSNKYPRLFAFTNSGDSIRLWISSDSVLNTWYEADGISVPFITQTIPNLDTDSEWHHVVYTWDVNGVAETLSLTFDGVRATSADAISIPASYSGFVNIGSDNNGGWGFNGSIDEVAIYNKALNSSEISELYDAGNLETAVTCGTPCTIDCAGKSCGDDNLCGGVCTVQDCTNANEICISGVCVEQLTCLDLDNDNYGTGADLTGCTGSQTLIDCNNSDASINPGATEICNNFIDDDCDNNIDCSDVNCASDLACLQSSQCNNGLDDDGDSFVDYPDDPDCTSSTDNSEAEEVVITGLPAFPGAEGLGAYSVGGRGGQVIKVTNLNDAGPGSFREAVTASGPRIVVFNVSGIIDLNSLLEITEPYITIAGQTSPGGILITGWNTKISTHDVLITHMRFRNGCQKCFAAGNCETAGDVLSIFGNEMPYGGDHRLDAYNIIVDHCSVSWGCDETMDISAWDALAQNITVSNCIIAEGVNDAHPEPNHARGLFTWGKRSLGEPITVSFHKNLVMSFYSRLPLVSYNAAVDFVNNVVYNFRSTLTPTLEPVSSSYKIEANMIHNYIKPGPLSSPSVTNGGNGREMWLNGYGFKGHMPEDATPYEIIYTVGNIGYTRHSQTGDDWIVSEGWSPTDLLSKAWQRNTPFPSEGIPITITIMSEEYADTIVDDAGATKPFRDSVDTRLISEYKAGDRGTYINMVDVVFPVFTTPTPPTDSDNDGMADAWEQGQGFNVGIDDSASDADSNGYTNIEEYLHYLAGDNPTITCPPDAHEADNNPCDGCVETGELDSYISRWLTDSTDVTIEEAASAIEAWMNSVC